MSYDEIIKNIKSKIYHPIYFLHGEEPFYIDKIADFVEEHILDESEKAFNLLVTYGKDTDYKYIIDEAKQYPMMSERRLIIIREAQEMRTILELVEYIEKPIPHTILVIVYKFKKFDKRTKFAKVIQDKAVVFESKLLYDNQIPAWITTYATSKKLKLDQNVANVMAEFLGTDLTKIANEIDKLGLMYSKGELITLAMMQELIGMSKEYNIFELQKVLAERDIVKANQIISYFIKNPKENPIQVIISNLFSYFNKVWATGQNLGEQDVALQRRLGLASPFFVKEYRLAAKNYPAEKCKQILVALRSLDLQSKGVENRSKNDAALLKELLATIVF